MMHARVAANAVSALSVRKVRGGGHVSSMWQMPDSPSDSAHCKSNNAVGYAHSGPQHEQEVKLLKHSPNPIFRAAPALIPVIG
jgi:hypothetical protein